MLIPLILLLSLLTIALLGLGVWFILADRAKNSAASDHFWPSAHPSFQSTPQPTPQPTFQSQPPTGERPSADMPLTWSGIGCVLTFGLAWSGFVLFFVVVMTYTFLADWQAYTLLRDTGQVVDGVILDRRIDYGSADDDDDYYLTYRYTAPLPQGDSQSFTEEASVSRSTYDAFPPERPVKVLYAPADPAVSELEPEFGSPFWPFAFFACFISLFVIIGVGMLTWGLNNSRKVLLLNARGQMTQGTLTHRWIDTDSDGDDTYCIAYRFEVPLAGSGPVLKGEQNPKAYNSLNVGDPVSVRYLPNNPTVCRLEL